jgi:hypothetical protein
MDDAIKELQSKVLAKPLLISQEQKLTSQRRILHRQSASLVLSQVEEKLVDNEASSFYVLLKSARKHLLLLFYP